MGSKHDSIKVKGVFRLQIEEDGAIVGDSGWNSNLITTDGFNNFLAKALGASAGSSQIGFVALGTGSAPASNATSLDQELPNSKRAAVTFASSTNSKAAVFTATFQSSNSFLGAQSNLSNIGLFASSSGGTLFAGTTYTSSACATNQNVNVTYQLNFTS